MEKNEKRELLKELTMQVKELVKIGLYQTCNEAIINEIYKDELNQEFKTFMGWKNEGKTVIKGEQGFIVWGKPIGKKEVEKEGTESEPGESNFFPMAHLFSNAQVEPIKK